MTSPALLTRLEDIIDTSGTAPRIEALLPIGVRCRQLRVRTLLLGMLLALADRRPAHLTEVHAALTALPAADRWRLGVTEDWKTGPHQLTYRQAERTFGLITAALAKDTPDGIPSAALATVLDDLLEASIPPEHEDASTALAADWTDVESFSRPPPSGSRTCADPEASWGHRKNNLLRSEDELFYGYYLSAAIMMPEENGPAVPEFARRATLSSCRHDPVRAFVPVLTAMPAAGIPLAGAEKFEDKDVDMTPQLQRLREAGADTVILVGNAAPGAQVVKSLQKSAWTVPVVSHWGISGGRFPELAGSWAGKVHFVQTYSFFGPQNDVGKRVLAALMAKYPDIKGPGDVTPPVGVANAYDAMQLTALALAKAGSSEGPKLREGLLDIESYQGLIKNYAKPFTDANHDALNENDYVMVRYNGDQIEPITG